MDKNSAMTLQNKIFLYKLFLGLKDQTKITFGNDSCFKFTKITSLKSKSHISLSVGS